MAKVDHTRLAVLIDADNAQATLTEELMSEVSSYGTATVRRAYGDWTTPNLKGWKDQLHSHAIQPIQQFRYVDAKNATDSALIIDAMDLLYSGHIDGFCIVSSDSDFTRLATRLREAGKVVYGFGEKKTPRAFVSACNKFIYTEILTKEQAQVSPINAPPMELRQLLADAVSATGGEDGWALLAQVGSHIAKRMPDFDARNYRFKKLNLLVRAQNYIEHKEVFTGESAHVAIRLKAGV